MKQREITGSPTGPTRDIGIRRIVVLKHETSTLRQSHNFISIDFKFGVDDYVRRVTSPAKLCLDPMSRSRRHEGQHIRDYGFFDFFILQHSYSPYP